VRPLPWRVPSERTWRPCGAVNDVAEPCEFRRKPNLFTQQEPFDPRFDRFQLGIRGQPATIDDAINYGDPKTSGEDVDGLPEVATRKALNETDYISAGTAAVAIPKIFFDVDAERRMPFDVEGTEANETLSGTTELHDGAGDVRQRDRADRLESGLRNGTWPARRWRRGQRS
jgi:hypothetical protein